MKIIDVREHTRKHMDLARRAAAGTYPSKKVAKAGSIAGLGIGAALLGVGVCGVLGNTAYGVGSIRAGAATVVSNCVNLRRIKNR